MCYDYFYEARLRMEIKRGLTQEPDLFGDKTKGETTRTGIHRETSATRIKAGRFELWDVDERDIVKCG